ncbi:unnamed protein product [Porites lobata]|uniref:E3 ubiquitin-protein ligase TRIM71 n=1 Tax=Porites lobata TaxID=104759 RepID=A0ABN8NIA0_9CNID|nr:unnamed protein product [Porites lobata]
MESLLKNLKEHVTCSICLDTFTEPKTIVCLHTFCCECLKRHALTTQREGKFRCPECQAQVGVPERFDQLPTGFLQNSLLGLLAVQKSGDGSEISCGNCRKKSAETSFCFNCGKFMCPDCLNAHELLRNVAFDGHKVRAIKHFQTEDYEALLKRQSFCSQQYHEREVTRFFCLECRTCVCQVCVVTDHRNHAVDPLDKAADHEKAKIMAGTELMKEKGKIYGDVIRELEKTIFVLETNISAAKREVSETAEQIIAKVRERERELITTLEDTRVIRTKKLNSLKTQVQSLVKQINQAIEFAEKLVQQSASSDIMQSKKSLEKRFEDLIETSVPTVFFTDSLTLGFVKNSERVVEGLEQEFQAGVEAELIFCPKLTDETEGSFGLDVNIKPAEKVGSLVTSKRRDGTFQVRFTTKVPGTYSIQGYENIGDFTSWSIFFGLAQVKQRRLEVREFDLNGEFQPRGIAVNSNKGLIAVTDVNGHCILLLDKEGNFLRKFGCKGTDIGQLNSPSDITFLNDSEILVAEELNHRIQQFNVHTGKGVKTFGKHGEGVGEFRNPTGVYRDGEERIFVADFNNSRIQVFTKEGEPVFSFGSGLLRGPTACIVHQNMFIVSDSSSQCLKIFDNSGNFLYMIGGKGRADGQLQWPGSLCIEKSGNHHNILVCDYNSHRIIQFTVEGSFTGKTIRKLQNPMCIAVTEDGRILVTCSRAPKIFILQ